MRLSAEVEAATGINSVNLLSRALLAGLSVAVAAGGLLRSRPPAARRRHAPALADDAIVAADGTRLPVDIRPATGAAPRGVVLALHGFGDHRKAFTAITPYLTDGGLTLYAYDQRGFGEGRNHGRWPGVDNLVGDLADAVTAIRLRHPDLPLALLAESMGGAIALVAVDRIDVDALVLAAPAVRGGLAEPRGEDLALRLAAVALPWLAVEVGEGGRPWLLPDEAKRIAEDPLIIRELSAGTYDGLAALSAQAADLPPAKTPPVLLLHGDLDTTIPTSAIDTLAKDLGGSAKLIRYPTRHHLLLHELGLEAVARDILDWLGPVLENAKPAPAHDDHKQLASAAE